MARRATRATYGLMADAVEDIFSKRETIDKTHIIDFARRRFSLESMAEKLY